MILFVLCSASALGAVACALRWSFPPHPWPRQRHALPAHAVASVPGPVGPFRLSDEVERRVGAVVARLAADVGVRAGSDRQQADLAIMERSAEDHLGTKVLLTVLAPAMVAAPQAVLWTSGATGRATPSPALLLVAAVAGYFVPDVTLRRAAAARRAELAVTVEFVVRLAYLGVSGDAGLETAFALASEPGEEWAHRRVRAMLGEAAVYGTPVSAAFERLGAELDVPAARTLGGVLKVSQEHGTPVRDALLQVADSVRTDRLRAAEVRAARGAVRLSFPVGLMLLGFLGLVLAGVIAQVLSLLTL